MTSRPLLTAVTHRWESDLAGKLGGSARVHLVRRCADLAELLGSVAAGLGQVVVVSVDLRGLDRESITRLIDQGTQVLGVHPPGDEAGERTLRRWGVSAVVPADVEADRLEAVLEELVDQPAAGGAGSRPTDDLPAAVGSSDASSRHAVTAATSGEDGADLAPGRGKVVVVWGPTGSPGRTTVAVNLAAEIAGPTTPTLLVDVDTYGAAVAQVLAVLDEAPGIAAAARAADQGTLDRAALAGLAPEVSPGLRVLTGLPRADRWPELREHAIADVLTECAGLAAWTVVDVGFCLEQDEEISFDTQAPRRNGATLAALLAADMVVVVGTADPVGLQRLVRGLDQIAQVCRAPRTLVVTRIRPGAVGSDPGRRVRESLQRFAGVSEVVLVPEDQDALDAAVLTGRALREIRPRSPAREAIRGLAEQLTGSMDRRAQQRSRRRRAWLGRSMPRTRQDSGHGDPR